MSERNPSTNFCSLLPYIFAPLMWLLEQIQPNYQAKTEYFGSRIALSDKLLGRSIFLLWRTGFEEHLSMGWANGMQRPPPVKGGGLCESGRPDSNRRMLAWEANALPLGDLCRLAWGVSGRLINLLAVVGESEANHLVLTRKIMG